MIRFDSLSSLGLGMFLLWLGALVCVSGSLLGPIMGFFGSALATAFFVAQARRRGSL